MLKCKLQYVFFFQVCQPQFDYVTLLLKHHTLMVMIMASMAWSAWSSSTHHSHFPIIYYIWIVYNWPQSHDLMTFGHYFISSAQRFYYNSSFYGQSSDKIDCFSFYVMLKWFIYDDPFWKVFPCTRLSSGNI